MDNIDLVMKKLHEDSVFAGENSSYASHNYHAFAAKFPPQLPRIFIESLTKTGDVVLDPMVGSGTAMVEALLLNRKGIGFDIDPLAIHLSTIKTSAAKPDDIKHILNKVLHLALININDKELIANEFETRFDSKTKVFINYWFEKKTQMELISLLLAFDSIKDEEIKELFKLMFSSIIITKSGGVSLARDLAHSRPHKDINKKPKSAIEAFSIRMTKVIKNMHDIPSNGGLVKIMRGDTRCLPLKSSTIDLIITSPPYANAIDYMRAHKFSLVWFNNSINALSILRSKYIGSEKTSNFDSVILPKICNESINNIHKIDNKKSKILHKYFSEMKLVISEMFRVLKKNKYCIIVVGNSTMRGFEVKTHKNIEGIGEYVGFKVIDNIERELDRDKRMMPLSFNSKNSGIEQRMHKEYIIIFQKGV